MHLSPPGGLGCCPLSGVGSVVVDFCLLLLLLWESVIVLCFEYYSLLYVHSSFAIILMGKREPVALVSLSSWCLLMVVWLFLAVTWVCLRFVIVVFPDHTHIQKCGSNTTAGEFVFGEDVYPYKRLWIQISARVVCLEFYFRFIDR